MKVAYPELEDTAGRVSRVVLAEEGTVCSRPRAWRSHAWNAFLTVSWNEICASFLANDIEANTKPGLLDLIERPV